VKREEAGDTWRHKGEGHMKTEAEMGGMWPQAQGCPELREAGRDSLEPPEGAQPCPTWISEFWSLRLGGNRLLLF